MEPRLPEHVRAWPQKEQVGWIVNEAMRNAAEGAGRPGASGWPSHDINWATALLVGLIDEAVEDARQQDAWEADEHSEDG